MGFKTSARKQAFENWSLFFWLTSIFHITHDWWGMWFDHFSLLCRQISRSSPGAGNSWVWPEVCPSRPHHLGLTVLVLLSSYKEAVELSDDTRGWWHHPKSGWRVWTRDGGLVWRKPRSWILREHSRSLCPLRRAIALAILIVVEEKWLWRQWWVKSSGYLSFCAGWCRVDDIAL